MSRYAILLDGGFLKRKLGSQQDPVTAERIAEFIECLCAHERLREKALHRIYFYDAPPLEKSVPKPLNGGRVNFGTTDLARSNRVLHATLARIPFFAMRYGELVFRGWKVANHKLGAKQAQATITAEDLQPNIQQKGVDMRIGLDIASLTLKDHVDVIVLVTGDSDFVPAMKFARREGAQLFLVTFDHAVTDDVFEHADLVLNVPNVFRSDAEDT